MLAKNLEIIYLDVNEFPLWNEFVKDSPQGTFFNTTTWLQKLEFVYNRPLKILVCKRNQEFVSGITFFENKKLFWRLITPVFLLPFNGPLFSKSNDTKPQKLIADQLEYVQLLLEHLKSDYDFVQLNTYHTFDDLRAFTWNDFNVEPEHTYLCKLENEKELFANYNQSLRKKIQKSKEQNLFISESKDIDTFIELYYSSYLRHELNPPVSKTIIKTLIQKILELPNTRLFFVKKEEKCLAGRIILKDENTIFDLLAGNNDESGLASSFLVAEIMKRYAGKFSCFDFLGADHPEIEKFKRAFGGEIVHRFKSQYHANTILKLLLNMRRRGEKKRRKI